MTFDETVLRASRASLAEMAAAYRDVIKEAYAAELEMVFKLNDLEGRRSAAQYHFDLANAARTRAQMKLDIVMAEMAVREANLDVALPALTEGLAPVREAV